MSRARPRIPPDLLRTSAYRREHSLVDALHRWLDRQRLTVAELTPDRLRRFLAQPRRVPVSRRASARYRTWLRSYLQWLHDHAIIDFAPAPPRSPPELPPLASEFLASLAPTHHPRTREAYTYALRRLHGWLAARGLELERLTRSELTRWLQELHA